MISQRIQMAMIIDTLSKESSVTINHERNQAILDMLYERLVDEVKSSYPVGSICGIKSCEYDHVIVGHILERYKAPYVQVMPINPRHSNDVFSNWDHTDIVLKPKDAR